MCAVVGFFPHLQHFWDPQIALFIHLSEIKEAQSGQSQWIMIKSRAISIFFKKKWSQGKKKKNGDL